MITSSQNVIHVITAPPSSHAHNVIATKIFTLFGSWAFPYRGLIIWTQPRTHNCHTWLRNFKELSACFEPFFLIQTCRTHCMCAACRSSESSPSVWSLSISISSTAQHWDSSPTCSEWPPSGSRHSWGSNTCSTRSQCCIWYDWPSALTSYTGIIIWYQRQGFGLVPIVSNRSNSNSSDQEINIWATRVEIWCATGVCSGSHSIYHLHHTTGPTHQEAWSDFPSICRRYPALFSIQTLRAFIHCQQHFSSWKVRWWYPGVDEVEFIETERRQDGTIGYNIST